MKITQPIKIGATRGTNEGGRPVATGRPVYFFAGKLYPTPRSVKM